MRAELERRWNAGQSKGTIRAAMNLTSGQLAGCTMRFNLHHRPNPRNWSSDAPFVKESRTKFPGRVSDAGAILQSGAGQSKLGSHVTKGAWKGFPIYAITLEERATCPRTCKMWVSCFGNNMHRAKRMRHGAKLERKLWGELSALQGRHPNGFVVRAHLLGDWYSLGYLDLWHEALVHFPALRVFGYTAWPHHTKIGRAVRNLRDMQWSRFAIRTSGANFGPATVVIDRAEDKPEDAIICPAQTGKTLACGTCGLCWAPAARAKTVAFLRH